MLSKGKCTVGCSAKPRHDLGIRLDVWRLPVQSGVKGLMAIFVFPELPRSHRLGFGWGTSSGGSFSELKVEHGSRAGIAMRWEALRIPSRAWLAC